MKVIHYRGALAGLGVCWFGAGASASSPLEYPDNGSAAFSRGGAWLAVANEPIATHYDPAGLALQGDGVSVEQQLAFPHTCFDRRGPEDVRVGPSDPSPFVYQPTCSARGSFPNTIPSIAMAWRVSDRVGVGVAIVPPATYGTAENQFPTLTEGYNTKAKAPVLLPAPYRYLLLGQHSTLLFPTVAVGVAITRHIRVGVGFISGIGVIDSTSASVSALGTHDAAGDHMSEDSLGTLRTQDLFVPGFVVSAHVSFSPNIDVAVWGRYLDSVRTTEGVLDVTQQPFDGNGGLNPPCAGAPGAMGTTYGGCSTKQSVPNHLTNALTRFEYPIPPEIRLAFRYHQPRTRSRAEFDANRQMRDPLREDVFDIELDPTVALNSLADTIRVRFAERDGAGTVLTNPTGVPVPPNADRPTGYRDSFGVRVGGQWNAVRDLLGLRAGGWFESRSQDPALLTVAPVGATRYGIGGGVVVRYQFMDVSVGYQRHLSLGLDNHGDGRIRATAAVGGGVTAFDVRREPNGVSAADRTEFRTVHAVNGGSVNFDAHVFTIGIVARL